MKIKFSFIFICLGLLFSCGNNYVPKPRGFFRIDLPEQIYQVYKDSCPFSFDHHINSIVKQQNKETQEGWLNVDYPVFNATIHLSYISLNGNVNKYIEDARTLAYKHTVKAMDIIETPIIRDSSKVYGLLYNFEGNTATGIQFYLTDSTKNFLRGALYFNVSPNEDSLKPVADYISKDVIHLIESVEWK